MPQYFLGKLVSVLQQDYNSQEHEHHSMHMAIPRIRIGLDCSLTQLRHGGLCLVKTTDFFYAIVVDLYRWEKLLVQLIYMR